MHRHNGCGALLIVVSRFGPAAEPDGHRLQKTGTRQPDNASRAIHSRPLGEKKKVENVKVSPKECAIFQWHREHSRIPALRRAPLPVAFLLAVRDETVVLCHRK